MNYSQKISERQWNLPDKGEREAAREAERERREFQIRVVCICAGFFAGVILAVIALAPMIGK